MSNKATISRTGKLKTVSSATYDVLRVEPKRDEKIRDSNQDRLTDLIIILFIFAIAYWIRFWAREIFINAYGGTGFWFVINDDDTLGIGSYLGKNTGERVNPEAYNDFNRYYIDYVIAFVDGWNPYSGNRAPDDVLNGYVYGPFYVYLIAIGNQFFDMSPEESIVASNIIFDSLSYVMVYVLARRVTGNMVAMIIALVGSFSPVAIFYAGIMSLNAPQMNFALLLFVYFFIKRRDLLSALALAFATLTKQFPLFLAMPFGFFMVRRYGFLKGISYFILFIMFSLLLSLPWIVLTPYAFFVKLFLPGGPKEDITCPQGGEAVNLVAGELNIAGCEEFFASGSTEGLSVSSLGITLDNLINTHLLLIGSLFLLAWVGFTAYDYFEKDEKLYYRFFAAYMALTHATIARGIYKYYLTLLIPLLLIAIIPGNNKTSFNLQIGAFLNRGWRLVLEGRYRSKEIKIQYWVLFGLMTISTLGVFWMIEAGVSMFTKDPTFYSLWLLALFPLALYFILSPSQNFEPLSVETIKPISEYNRMFVIILILASSFGWLAYHVGLRYYAGNSERFEFQLLNFFVIFASFILIPIVAHSMTKDKIYSGLTLNLPRLLMDLIILALAFYFFDLMNKQILLINRYLTPSLVLASSIFLLGLLGGEVWSSFFIVPYRALVLYSKFISQRVRDLRN